jgi:hypothetical protein
MPMLAARAAVPATSTPAIAAAVTSEVRLVMDRFARRGPPVSVDGVDVMQTTVRIHDPAGGKTKAHVG